MSIPGLTKTALYQRAKGQCECRMKICRHHPPGIRCPNTLLPDKWEVHQKVAGGSDDLDNLIAMCDRCYKTLRKSRMDLIITRREGESFTIGDDIKIKIIKIIRGQVKLLVESPKGITVLKTELDPKEVK